MHLKEQLAQRSMLPCDVLSSSQVRAADPVKTHRRTPSGASIASGHGSTSQLAATPHISTNTLLALTPTEELHHLKEENLRLQRKLQQALDKIAQLERDKASMESNLELDEVMRNQR